MPAAGDPVYASDVRRARPTFYRDVASSALPAGSSSADVPGVSIVFETETDGAEVACWWSADMDPGTGTGMMTCRVQIDGPSGASSSYSSDTYAVGQGDGTSSTRFTTPANYKATLGDAGTYTAKLVGTAPANTSINLYTSLMICVQEQFE